MMSGDAARPMTRFVQYPFDKSKMAEVRDWVNGEKWPAEMRAAPGVKDVELSFCPGEGWLAARYIFNDLDDMARSSRDAVEMEPRWSRGAAETTSRSSRHPCQMLLETQQRGVDGRSEAHPLRK